MTPSIEPEATPSRSEMDLAVEPNSDIHSDDQASNDSGTDTDYSNGRSSRSAQGHEFRRRGPPTSQKSTAPDLEVEGKDKAKDKNMCVESSTIKVGVQSDHSHSWQPFHTDPNKQERRKN
ncbi:hypothetical protein SERLADRAFT_433702 [Serpula lacrymans var. lacrymans S7.9]|uniref:Uncharacterized protein n=1 Tax=Serpula lacrymans var. lacrymans (strain S7.9) TaxID=578457 RepID=F8NI14_SERL9|nr:uncharacterized protein SERLADRAFT_433702 [Serpula lacrymans var. lacrymans S7.9]EGO29736.1 hypothetical protein SERLADRAFT_433702 [Serpula lacrymans var. lacrymans S7.9]